MLLRRMKEDVENLPDKEEVVVWVELTTEQRHFYKAIYGKQVLCFRLYPSHKRNFLCRHPMHGVLLSTIRQPKVALSCRLVLCCALL